MLKSINKTEALRYMGCRQPVDGSIMKIVDECEKALLSNIKPKYIYKFFDIKHTDEGVHIVGTDIVLTGSDIARHTAECGRAVLLAATLSADADRLIRKYEITDMTYALAADALASAAVEQVCSIAENEIKQTAENMTWRFSPGYGDFSIEFQPQLLALTDAARKIGLTVTENNILIPRKSVTAIIGVSENAIPKQRRGCAICSMNKSCQYRKRGLHCGT